MAWRRRSLVLSLAALVGLATACEVAVEVTVTVEDDGSGRVEVAVGLDEDALARVPSVDPSSPTGDDQDEGSGEAEEDDDVGFEHDPFADLVALIRVADLEAAGWETAPPETVDGVTWVRMVKPFGTPEEGTQVLGELTGPGGALRDVEIVRSTSFGTDRFRFTGTADLSAGLEGFADEGLAEALGGEPLGEDEAAMEARYGRPVAELFDLEVRVDLPGADVESWSPELGGSPVAMEAESARRDLVVWGLAGVAALCGLALVGLFVVRTLRSARDGR